ncbi:hypothetical protein VCM39_01975 [Bacteroides sp. CG01]|uniref:hypothetical protein n=1 Tax=Bacteroides sp. CG01 TaxID=3096000 RepID=UPI002AFF77CF|nr:hypothetical protein [Bacteroides sp. CG01]
MSTNHSYRFKISDPDRGKYTIDQSGFLKCWTSTKQNEENMGVALIISPTPAFYEQANEMQKQTSNMKFFLNYLFPYKSQLI